MRFKCTALLGQNKVGKLLPDENGLYEVLLGALDYENSIGAEYSERTARELFKSSSSLMRRIAKNVCRGEYGHPRKEIGEKNHEFLARVMDINEERVSHTIKECWIDYNFTDPQTGRKCIAIFGKIEPMGPYGKILKQQLESPNQNVCFSIRSFTEDEVIRGKLIKNLKLIVTWDYVNEGGIELAQKFKSPSLENFNNDFDELILSENTVNKALEQMECVGMESNSKQLLTELKSFMKNKSIAVSTGTKPSSKW